MRFGPVPLAEAEGATLAHSLRPGKLNLKKGHRLTAADLQALADAGLERVVVARLDPGDVEENEAALAIAEAVYGEHVAVAKPFTGRVNLHADAAGLCVVDREGVDRLNRIHESVTIGTLPAFEPVRRKQMVATIKIIPFAVAPDVFERCLAVAREGGPLVRVAPFRPLRVRLIQTRLPGTAEKMLDKTVEVTRRRIEAFGGTLAAEARCAHDEAELAATIREVLRGGPTDLLLIAGASAITDRRDVLPAGIVAAGGAIDHFGMPVDPGNLLLLARLGDGRPALGLPGCCRSPKINGLDWVLNRLAAGLEVGPADIMGMGVGGLLTEIPSRPQPREVPPPPEAEEEEPAPRQPKVAAVVLAAGQSRRMGARNKLLAEIDGQPMVARVVDAVRNSKADPVIVVTGHERERVEAALAKRRGLRLVHNPDYADGLSTSLRAGLGALPDGVDGALICLGDMPRMSRKQINRLIEAFDPEDGRAVVVPTVRGKRGNPVLWGRAFFDEMRGLAGDVGARHLIGQYGDRIVEVEMDDDAALVDIDTPAALDAFLAGAPAP